MVVGRASQHVPVPNPLMTSNQCQVGWCHRLCWLSHMSYMARDSYVASDAITNIVVGIVMAIALAIYHPMLVAFVHRHGYRQTR